MTPAKPAPTLPEKLEWSPLVGMVLGLLLDATPGRPKRAVTSQLTGVSEAEGREIAKRYNAHGALVAAIEDFMSKDISRQTHPSGCMTSDQCICGLKALRALLATVRGRP